MDSALKDGAIQPADYESGLTDEDRLDLRVWLRLLTCSNMIERTLRDELRQRFDMTLPRFDILSQLDRAPDGLTMGDLSRRLMVSNGNVTGLIGRMVEEGLVKREAAAHDRRAQVVQLTDAGRQAFRDMVPAHASLVHDLFGGLSRNDLEKMLTLLGQLKDGLAETSTNGNTN